MGRHSKNETKQNCIRNCNFISSIWSAMSIVGSNDTLKFRASVHCCFQICHLKLSFDWHVLLLSFFFFLRKTNVNSFDSNIGQPKIIQNQKFLSVRCVESLMKKINKYIFENGEYLAKWIINSYKIRITKIRIHRIDRPLICLPYC